MSDELDVKKLLTQLKILVQALRFHHPGSSSVWTYGKGSFILHYAWSLNITGDSRER
jgi:hypothetical protein